MRWLISLLLLTCAAFSCKNPESVVSVLPVVQTHPATGVTSTSAIISGTITETGTGHILRKGFYLSHDATGDSVLLASGGNFSYELVSLNSETTYFYRAFAVNDAGTSTGNELYFTTLHSEIPIVITGVIKEVSRTTAVSGGLVSDSGTLPVIARGVCFSTHNDPTIQDPYTTDGTGNGYFTSQIHGLAPRTAYYLRAYATNAHGTGYGKTKSFTTADTNLAGPCAGLDSVVYAGRIYHTVLIGSKCWFRENLNVGNLINGRFDMVKFNSNIEKYCYNDLESNCDVYGGLYQWDEMMQSVEVEGTRGICPLTWHIPTRDEWNTMINNYGGIQEAGLGLKYNTSWSGSGNGTNRSGFSALAGGYRTLDGTFSGLGDQAGFWSSLRYSNDQSWNFMLSAGNQTVNSQFTNRRMGYSVRCVKD
ncbi:MAG: FISUMP domain-containing protein [Syntrophothermus sp.]